MAYDDVQSAIEKYISDNPPPSKYVFGADSNPKGHVDIKFKGHGVFGHNIPFLNHKKLDSFYSETNEGVDASKMLLDILEGSGEIFWGKVIVSGGTHVSGTRRLKAYSVKKEDSDDRFLYYYPNGTNEMPQIAAKILESGLKIVDPDVASIDGNALSLKLDVMLPAYCSKEEAFEEIKGRYPESEVIITRVDPNPKNTHQVDLSCGYVKKIIDGGIDPTDITYMDVVLGKPEGDFEIKIKRIDRAGKRIGYHLDICVSGNVESKVLDLISKGFGWKDENGSDLSISSTVEKLYQIKR